MNAIIREKQLLQSPFPSFGMSPSDPPITVSQRWDEPIRSSDYRFPALGRAHPTLRLPFPSVGTSPSDPPITVSQRWDEPIRPSDYRFPALGRAHPTLRSPFPSFGTGSSDPPIIISQRWDEPAALVRWDFQDSPRFIPYVHVKGCSLAGNLSNASFRLIFRILFFIGNGEHKRYFYPR